jgi:S1-C subfamily serine protease
MTKFRILFVISLIVAVAVSQSTPALDREELERATQATAYLRVARVFHGIYFPTTGTGFFIHPDGYLLTNWHVIADQIEMYVDGERREIPTNVLSLEVVIASGTPQERVIPGEIIARDRETDLALIRVPLAAPSWIDPADIRPVRVTDRVWVIGYPFGGLLALEDAGLDAADKPNPEVTVTSGMVTSLRHNRTGVVEAVQVDAAVNPGNSGGPLLDDAGRLTGVVRSMIFGGQGLGFAISSGLVNRFIDRRAIRAAFQPPVIASASRPLQVIVHPLLKPVDASSAEVQLQAKGLETVVAPLNRAEDGSWAGSVELPDSWNTPNDTDVVVAAITLHGSPGVGDKRYSYRIRRLTEGEIPGLKSQRDPASVMRDRRDFANEESLSDLSRDTSDQKTTRLSDVAKGLDLNRSSDGSVQIDQHSVEQSTASKSPQRYQNLIDPRQIQAAKTYDEALTAYRKAREVLLRHRSDRPGRRNPHLEEAVGNARRQLTDAAVPARTLDIVLCESRNAWYPGFELPPSCRVIHRPGEVAD